jgi:hypothetical protein
MLPQRGTLSLIGRDSLFPHAAEETERENDTVTIRRRRRCARWSRGAWGTQTSWLRSVSRHRPYDFFAPLRHGRDAKGFLSVGWRVDIGSTAIPAGSSRELNDRAAYNWRPLAAIADAAATGGAGNRCPRTTFAPARSVRDYLGNGQCPGQPLRNGLALEFPKRRRKISFILAWHPAWTAEPPSQAARPSRPGPQAYS